MKRLKLLSAAFITTFILLILTLSLTTAHGMSPIIVIPNAGGDGTGAVSTTGGAWNDDYQGIRITVLDHSGEVAFTFAGKDHLDLLFSYPGEHSYFGDNHKMDLLRTSSGTWEDLYTLCHSITIADFVSAINNNGWGFVSPGDPSETLSNFANIPKPLDKIGESWFERGTDIKNLMYGTSDENIMDTAALYAILNMHNGSYWLWQPKSGAYFGDNPFTTAEINEIYGNFDPENGPYPMDLMASKNLYVSAEPIIWSQLRLSSKQYSDYSIYGTQTEVGYLMDFMINSGMDFANAFKGGIYGGFDTALYGKHGRRSMILPREAVFPASRDASGNVINESFSIVPPNDTGQLITNTEVSQMSPGWALHLYLLKGGPQTHTWDDDQYPDPDSYEEHPAPDPEVDTCTKDKVEGKEELLHYNIVKFYEVEIPSTTGISASEIKHVATYERLQTFSKIEIQDEIEAGGYEVVEWKWSADPKAPVVTGKAEDGATPWDDPMIESLNTPLPSQVSTPETRVGVINITNIKDDGSKDTETETTLYVRLRKPMDVPETHTYDDPDNPPGPAPDPLAPDEDPDMTEEEKEQLVHNIVKVYETLNVLTGTLTTDGVFTRQTTAGIIQIENEEDYDPSYTLIEWQYGKEFNTGSDWDSTVAPVNPLGSGHSAVKVDIRNPDDIYESRTLYVRLRKTEGEPKTGQITIFQSQISKAIHTNDSTIGGENWGDYKFILAIGPCAETHTYHLDHGCCLNHGYWKRTSSGGRRWVITCWTCHGHECEMDCPGIDGDEFVTFVWDQIGGEADLQIADGVHSSTDHKVYKKKSHKEEYTDFPELQEWEEYTDDGKTERGKEMVIVLWRGNDKLKDLPTMPLYKQEDIENEIGSANWEIPQAMLNNASNKSKLTRKSNGDRTFQLETEFGVDLAQSDITITATCISPVPDSFNFECIHYEDYDAFPTGGTEWTYEFKAEVVIQTYKGQGNVLAAEPFGMANGGKKTVATGTHFNNNIVQGIQQIKFFPYIRMTYMTNSLDLAIKEEANKSVYVNNSRYDTYVLSEYESAILPSDAVEVGWTNNNEKESLLLTSQQWSLHQRAVNGGEAWNGTNQVLPGGAIYQLSTPKTSLSNVKIITYQTVVDDKTRGYLSVPLTGDEYTVKKVYKDHEDFVNDAKETLDNLRIVQWVSRDYNATYAWPNDWVETGGDGKVCIRGGGESLAELGLRIQTSSEEKYYMLKSTSPISYQSAKLGDKTDTLMGEEKANEGDLDIMTINQVTTVFKIFTDTSGNVYLASMKQSGVDNVEAQINSMVNSMSDLNADTMHRFGGVTIEKLCDKTISGSGINSILSGDAKQIDDRTSFITNAVLSITRNKGMDRTAKWAKDDGTWYNEAFDGIYLVRQAVTMEVGLQYSSYRASALDPALCPANVGQSDLYTNAFMSQFCLNDKSDAAIAQGKDERYLGTFREGTSQEMEIFLSEMEGMYQSRKFYIPNANVQDLN